MHRSALLPTLGSSEQAEGSLIENHAPILLVSGATRTVREHGDHPRLGRFIQPRSRNNIAELALCGCKWAGDNDALAGLDPDQYLLMLDCVAAADRSNLLFITVPDDAQMTERGPVVSWPGTLALWRSWRKALHKRELPAAIVLQDGATIDTVPWSELAAVFVGGSDAWKEGPEARALLAEAGRRKLWRHVGRINTLRRYWLLHGSFDSYDGSGFSKWPKNIGWMLDHTAQQRFC